MLKLDSDNLESGISSVIGVILMVAIVVALVALISIVVFDVTSGPQEETSTAGIQVSNADGSKVNVQLVSDDLTEEVVIETTGGQKTISEVGESATVDSFGEQVTVIGVTEGGSRSVLRSIDPSESGSTTASDDNTTFVDPESSTTSGNIDGNAYNTLEAAENAVSTGDSIVIRSGVHRVPNTVQATVSKDVTIGVQDNVVFECAPVNSGKVNLNFTRTPAVVNGAQNIATRGCGNADLPPDLEDDFSVSLDNRTVATGSSVTLSANLSNIGQDDIESITWDFGDSTGATGNPVTHTYSSTGDYTVTVEVTSKEGTTESASATYNVESSPSSIAPVAAFDYSPVGPTVNQRVEFNASSSSDQDGSVDSYNWDLDDDGTFESSGQTASKIYNSTGEKNVRLQVEDNNGNVDETVQSVLIDSTGDVNPEFSVSMSDRTIPVGETALFSANISNIGVSQISSINWDFDDGTTSTGNPATNTYSSTGSYTVTVDVTSEQGVTNSDIATVTVTSNPPSEPIDPQPSISITPENPVTGEQVTFNGEGSQDIDGVITSYEWDLDNDGIFEKNGSEVTRSYSYIAEQDVQLRVTDNDENSNTTVSSVLISSDASGVGSGSSGGGGDNSGCNCIYNSGSGDGSATPNAVTGVVEVNPEIQDATVRSVDRDTGEVLDTSQTDGLGQYLVTVEEYDDEIQVITENDIQLNGRPLYASSERKVSGRDNLDFNFSDTVNSTVNGNDVTVAYSITQENTDKQVGTPQELRAMSEDLDGDYEIVTDIDASGTSSWNSGSGFKPIAFGSGLPDSNDFTGTIQGKEHSISGLYVDRDDVSVGLISQAYNAEITDLRLNNVDMKHDSTDGSLTGYTGGLYGAGDGVSVTDVSVNGTVNSQADVSTGGVAGEVASTSMSNVSSEVDVTSDGYAGGLVGSAYSGTIADSSATGSITSNQGNAGGLLGESRQVEMEVTGSYATGDVTGDSATGGLIGFMRDGKVSESFASGSVVSNNGDAGGLVGNATGEATALDGYIEDAYSIGSVDGSSATGGLVGSMEQVGTGDIVVRRSFATGQVSSGGGLIGAYSGSDTTAGYWDTESTGAATSDTGFGLTTSDMQGYTPSSVGSDTMSGLDFNNTWDTVTGNYPVLELISSKKQLDTRSSSGGIIDDSLVHRLTFENDFSDSYGSWNPSNSGVGFSSNSKEGSYSGNANGDSLNIGRSTTIDDSSAIAFVFWIQFDSTSNGQGIYGLDFTDANWYLHTKNGNMVGAYRSYGNNPATSWGPYSSGKWYSVAFQYNGDRTELWIDGELKDTNYNGGGVNNRKGDNTIFEQKGYRNLNGRIDDFRVYNRTLSEKELTDIANR